MNAYKRVHFVGIGGIGMSAMAKLLKAQDVYVSGSDVNDSVIVQSCRDMNIQVWLGSHPDKMGKDVELVVYSGAVPEDDEERIRGRHLDAREVVYNEFLGEVSRDHKLIAVTGTHGKSTTTALLGKILIDAGLDPTVVVGSQVPGLKYGNLQVGKSNLFVAEACEYQSHMLHLDPDIIVLTNIEFDHPDFYKDVDHVRSTMKQFVEKLPEGGILVWNKNDEQSRILVGEIVESRPDIRLISHGDDAEFYTVVESLPGDQLVHVYMQGIEIGDVHLPLPGEYNVANAMSASLAAYALDVPSATIKQSLESFPGLWRRFEKLGKFQDADVYSDYAHHPTALASLLEGTKTFLPDRRIVLCFQPHQHARTRGLFDEFVVSMDDADEVVLIEIYDVAGRNEVSADTSSAELVEAIKKHDQARGVVREVIFAKDLVEARTALGKVVRKDYVLLMAGAGSIDGLARELVQ
ncbi:UDP-N-acetylmuramate--L-alanine ligase [Candidatus Uhrbacteria bacterium]|nr:UDP-N-acetylmuramate--L-alanine ligase [Candidatus Uhrbacteria bacterium]